MLGSFDRPAEGASLIACSAANLPSWGFGVAVAARTDWTAASWWGLGPHVKDRRVTVEAEVAVRRKAAL